MYSPQPASSAPGPSGPAGIIREIIASRHCRSADVKTSFGDDTGANLMEDIGTNAHAIVATVPVSNSRRLTDCAFCELAAFSLSASNRPLIFLVPQPLVPC